jgi:alanine racemase
MRATRALIHLEHLRGNLGLIRQYVQNGPMICLAVKADGYGHGITEIGRTAEELGIEYLAVATVDEATDLRTAGISLPILLYSLPTPEEIPDIFDHDATPVIADIEMADLLDKEARRRGRRLPVHMKIDTGMGRIGCTPENATELARNLAAREGLSLEGISTHFAKADDADRSFTEEQIGKFTAAVAAIRGIGIDPGIVHAGNSCGVLGYRDAWFDMIRPGLLAYGYHPSADLSRELALKPVMELRSRIIYIKEVPRDTPVSYGATWRAPQKTHIGTVPVGYGDGFSRALSNSGEVTVRGTRYPIVGRVCMDHIMIDLGPELQAERYDEVTLFGPDPAGPTAEDLALWSGTIPYEIICAVSKRVPRVYVNS